MSKYAIGVLSLSIGLFIGFQVTIAKVNIDKFEARLLNDIEQNYHLGCMNGQDSANESIILRKHIKVDCDNLTKTHMDVIRAIYAIDFK